MPKIVTFLLLFISISFSSSVYDVSISDQIDSAINSRDDFYSRNIGAYREQRSLSNNTIKEQILKSRDRGNSWYYYYLGNASTNPKEKEMYYNKSINLCKNNIGNLWVLFLEFYKQGNKKFQDIIINKISFLANRDAVLSIPTIQEQLVILSKIEYLKGNIDYADKLLKESEKFAVDNSFLSFSKFLLSKDSDDFYSFQNSFVENIQNDWKTEVNSALFIIKEIKIILFVFIFFVIVITITKYYTTIIHSASCMYPQSIPYRMRVTFSSIIFVLIGIFGLYPLAVAFILLALKSETSKGIKKLLSVSLIVLILLPLLSFVSGRFLYTLSDNSPLVLYEKAVYDAPTPDLYSEIKEVAYKDGKSNVEKAINTISLALIQYKRGNIKSAVSLSQKAYSLWPEGEPVLLATGAIYRTYGDSKKAYSILKKCVELYPSSPEANYNFGQINLERVGIEDGTKYSAKAGQIAPAKIDDFISRNSSLFKKYPERKFFIGGITPQLFWNNFSEIFSSFNIDFVNQYWGARFFGLPPIYTTIAIIILLIITHSITPTISMVKSRGYCSLCGRPICKKCSSNGVCNDCKSMLEHITNENLVEKMKIKLNNHQRTIITLKAHIIDMIFPGTKDLFLKKKTKKRMYFLIPITFITYIYYITIISNSYSIIDPINSKIKLILLIPVLIYNLIFIINNFVAIMAYKEEY